MFNKKEYEHQRYLENKEKIKKASKNYYDSHKTERKEWHLKTQKERKDYREFNSKRIEELRKIYREKHPWIETYINIIQRCTNPNHRAFKVYKNRLGDITVEQLKEIWFECKAYLMEKPEIDRIDNNGKYTKNNLQYIEKIEHTFKTAQERKLKKLGVKYESSNH